MITDRLQPTRVIQRRRPTACRLAVQCLSSLSVVMCSAAIADVTPGAASASVTTVNSVPVVDIVAPTPAGVSHNTFQTFDVDAAGVVINNSLQGGVSVATSAGAIPANSNFNGASASIILNEVTSTSRSSLSGVTEILGDDASYILANPNGITCDGCGFVRTPTVAGDNGKLSEVILSTSDALSLTGGKLNSLTVNINSSADIIIGPGGLDASGVDVTTLFTRLLSVDGLINAGNGRLQTLLGTGTLNFDAAQPQDRSLDVTQSDDNALVVAVDASLAGAMQAGQIYILATENGVGVTMDNSLIANVGDVVVTAEGDIVYRNITASDAVNVTSQSAGMVVTGNTLAGNDINLDTTDSVIVNSGAATTVQAGNEVNVNCSGASCSLNSEDTLTINANRLNTNVAISTADGNSLSINAGISSTATMRSGNILAIDAMGSTVTAGDLSAGTLVDIQAGDINVGAISTVEGVDINSTGQLTTGDITADLVNVFSTGEAAIGHINTMNLLTDTVALDAGNITADNFIDITTAGSARTLDVTAVGDAALTTGALVTGNVDAGGGLSLIARSGNINAGSLAASGDIDIATQTAGESLVASTIDSRNGNVRWQLNGQSALDTDINATRDITLECGTPGCAVQSATSMQLAAQNLITQAALRTTNGSDLGISANVSSSADIISDGNLTIAAVNGDIISSASLGASKQLAVDSAQNADVRIDGNISSGGDFVVSGQGNYTHANNALLSVGGDWIIDSYSLTNNGTIVAGDLPGGVFRVNRLLNNGLLQSDGALMVQVDELLQNNGVISSLEGVISIRHSQDGARLGQVDNNGIISAVNLSQQQQPENTLIINPQSLVDDFAAAIARGEQRTAAQLMQQIEAANQQALSQLSAGTDLQGAVSIEAATLNNAESGVISASDLVLQVGNTDNRGLLLAAQNIAVSGDSLVNNNGSNAFGVIAARDNIDISLSGEFDNDGIIEAVDILIDAPVQNNNTSELVLTSRNGQSIDTASVLEEVAAQAWFTPANPASEYFQYSQAGDNNPLLQSSLSLLSDRFLQSLGVSAETLPQAIPMVGDDVFLAQLISAAIREDGELPFVTDSRSPLLQLAALYNNTASYMADVGLGFGVLPNAAQRDPVTAPVIIFQPQSLQNGDQVYAPTVLLPGAGDTGQIEVEAEQISSRIFAYNELLLRGDSIGNSGHFLSGNKLTIEAIDLKLTTTARNWYVDETGKVQYIGAVISAPSLALNVSGDYVQQGGQLLSSAPLLLEANNISVDAATVKTAGGESRNVQADIQSQDALYLLAKQRAEYGTGSRIRGQADTVLRAATDLQFDGKAESSSVLQLEANNIILDSTDRDAIKAKLAAGQSLLLQAKDDISLGYAIISAGNPRPQDDSNTQTASGDIALIAEVGNIINTASEIVAANSGFMQAGGDILNLSVQTVVDNPTQTVVASSTQSNRVYDDDADAGILDYADVSTTKTITTTYQSQRVDTDVATISTGAGGLTQIAGGTISNIGDIRSRGDILQKTEGSINNDIMSAGYTRSRIITDISVQQQSSSWRGSNTDVYTSRIQTAVDDVAVQTGTIEAGGTLVQIAGGTIGNVGGVMRSGDELYQQAEGDISNISLTNNTKLITGIVESGGGMTIDAKGNYRNTGNLTTTNSISISAVNIDNERLTRRLANTRSSHTVSENNWTAITDATTTTGRQQVLDTGRIAAGDNIILNASSKITDIAGRYQAGGNGEMRDADGNLLLDAQGNAVRGGIYASASQGIELKDIAWQEKDSTVRETTRKYYDDDSDAYTQSTLQTQIGVASRDYTVTGKLQAAVHVSLSSERGDVILNGADINTDKMIALKGRNVALNANSLAVTSNSQIGRTINNSKTISNDLVELNAAGGINITTTGTKADGQGNLNTQGTIFNAGAGNVMFNVSGDIKLDGINNETGSYYEHTRKRSFGRRKTTIRETRNVGLDATTINTEGSLLVNVTLDENGELVGTDSGRVKLEGAKINAGSNAVIYGDGGVDVLSGIKYDYTRNETHRRGFAGLSRSGSSNVIDKARLGHAEFNTGGDTVLLSKGNINVVAGKIDASNITADATFGMSETERAAAKNAGRASVNIIGDKEVIATFDHKYKRSIKLGLSDNFLSFAEELTNKNWKTTKNAIGSNLLARESINVQAASDILISGSGLTAAEDVKLNAGRHVNILGAFNNLNNKEQNDRERVGVEVKSSGNSVDAFAGREQLTVTDQLNASNVLSSGLQAGNDIIIKAGGDITQSGSDVVALSDVAYVADGSIKLDVAATTRTQQYDEVLRRDGLSSSFVYDYDQTREALDNAGEGDDAISKVSSTLQAVDSVNNFISGPSANLFAGNTTSRYSQTATAEQARGSSVKSGGSVTLRAGEDINIVASAVIAELDVDLDAGKIDIRDAQNVSSQGARSRFDQNGAALTAQRSTASVGVMTSFNRQQNAVNASASQSSLIAAGRNTRMKANTDISVTGSDINTENDITFDAGRNILIQAAASQSSIAQKGNSGGAGTGIAVTANGAGGAAVGIYVSGNASRNRLNRSSTEYRNSQITSGNRLTVISGGDVTLAGANAEAEQVNLDIGGDLRIASAQDTGKANGEQQDVSVRVVGGGGAAVSGSVGRGSTAGNKAWVNQQTTLIARERLEGNIAGHTQLDGAVLASKTGNMKLETGSLSFSNISDVEKERSSYLNLGISTSDAQSSGSLQQQNNRQTGLPVNSGLSTANSNTGMTIRGNNSRIDRAQITRATLGQGDITVREDQNTGTNSLAGLNRDLGKSQQITRDERSETQIYASDSAISSVQNPLQTAESWLQGLNNYALGSMEMYQFMSKSGELAAKGADTPFESAMASLASGMVDAANMMSTVTLGVAPTVSNYGGLASQVAALAVGDQYFRRVKVKLQNAPGTGQVELQEVTDDQSVTLLNQGETVTTNGILNSFEEAALNGAMQSNSDEFTLAYNPTHGVVGDLVESAWDKWLGGVVSCGNARDLQQFYDDNIGENISFNIAAHSQGGLLNLRAVEGLDFSNGGNIQTGTVLFSGAPVDSQAFYETMDNAGFDVSGKRREDMHVVFQTNRFDEAGRGGMTEVDPISDLLGGNYRYGENGGFFSSLISMGTAWFGDTRLHSNYLCTGLTCGYRSNVVLDVFRNSSYYHEPTVIPYMQNGDAL